MKIEKGGNMLSVKTLLETAACECGWGQDTMINAMIHFIERNREERELFECFVVKLVYDEWLPDDPHLTREEVRGELGLD
jgi:hypothetical protein